MATSLSSQVFHARPKLLQETKASFHPTTILTFNPKLQQETKASFHPTTILKFNPKLQQETKASFHPTTILAFNPKLRQETKANFHPTTILAFNPKLQQETKASFHPTTILAFNPKCKKEAREPERSSTSMLQTSRRASVGLAVTTLFSQLATGVARAYVPTDNGYWLTSPLPVPTVTNKIFNEETGTRSFVKKEVYIANIGVEGSAYRIRQYAFDLLALGDLLGQDAWSLVSKYLCLKSTIMYFDFDKLISAAADDQKLPLTNLANRLFDSVERLEDAVKKRSESTTQSCYAETETILKEVMTQMADDDPEGGDDSTGLID